MVYDAYCNLIKARARWLCNLANEATIAAAHLHAPCEYVICCSQPVEQLCCNY